MPKPIHTMIRVLDENRSVKFYQDAFSMIVEDRFEFDSFTLIYLRTQDSSFELELTINKGRTEPYDLGDGYGHIALVTEDLAGDHSRLTDLGLEPRDIVEFERDGALLAKFFFVQDPDGYQIEVLQKHGRYR
ncbi:VOC family protein [Hoeflea sp. TYP-13]|uniref:VOC family protein n=1 Tax=Hoeflea sp. TYP-13 TaxID=3230023 RepID=UPI0034C6A977